VSPLEEALPTAMSRAHGIAASLQAASTSPAAWRRPTSPGCRAPPLLEQGRSGSSTSIRPSPTSVVWCLWPLALKADGNFPAFSRSVFYILPFRFRFFGKSGTGSEYGYEVVGMRTDVEMALFRPDCRNPGFSRNVSVFNPELFRI
jgi:hypothetical protein